LHALHELRERLELRPLVVCRPDRDVDVDRLGDLAHGKPPCGGERGPLQINPACRLVPPLAAPLIRLPAVAVNPAEPSPSGGPSPARRRACPGTGSAA